MGNVAGRQARTAAFVERYQDHSELGSSDCILAGSSALGMTAAVDNRPGVENKACFAGIGLVEAAVDTAQ